ncbi:DUF7284 family protein [Halapricum hydrolyticum]|uniref:Uncharacterized protein n=1 Tax=Halapricum hydrolyticum TaxID=2979991 RepID=A0AAE3I9L4_9EURY|nr:hypothetical protein [Halapricum hydrolyticum]MCU4716508.1 hypothetical protein [Halapricum hydrolyticum]MCU4725887.1 hypothetical protein [Halapricum hydrolyticum]
MSQRGISTVVDATLALLLISASILVVATSLAADQPGMDLEASDHVSETVSISTANVSYSLRPVVDDIDDVDFEDDAYSNSVFQRQRYGSVADLVASSTMLNVTIEGRQLTREGEIYADAVEGSLMEALTGLGYDAYVTGRWQPYDGASIAATGTYGSPPPGDADVQLATLRVPSGVQPVSEDVEDAYEDGYGTGRSDQKYERAAGVLAETIVERYLPAGETQVALEGQWFRRDLAVYRYLRIESILAETEADSDWGDEYYHFDPATDENVLGRSGANATKANAYLARGTDGLGPSAAGEADGLRGVIEDDLKETISHEEMKSFDESSSIEEIVITVRVWRA